VEDRTDLSIPILRDTVARWLSTERFELFREAASPLPAETDNVKLRAGIIDAVFACLVGHLASPLKRYADNRKVLLRVKADAEAAAEALRALSLSLDDLFPWSRNLLFEHFHLTVGTELAAILSTIHLVGNLAPIAREHADLLKKADRGGRPQLHAFACLVDSLARGYAAATGHPATVTNDPYLRKHGGPFIRLVDALLPSVEEVLDLVTGDGRPLELPISKYARGQKIREVLRRRRKAGNPTSRRA
jgi:hypothetical protein